MSKKNENDKLKKKNKKLKKTIEGLRGDIADLYNAVEEIGEQVKSLHDRWAPVPRHSEVPTERATIAVPDWASKIKPGDVLIQTTEGEYRGIPQPDGSFKFGPFLGAEVSHHNILSFGEGATSTPAPDGGIIDWDEDEGRAVQVREVTPNADPERAPYTFWFTDEMCERLGIENIQRHLREKPGGQLEMVDGPPVELLPEHAELVRDTLGRGMQ